MQTEQSVTFKSRLCGLRFELLRRCCFDFQAANWKLPEAVELFYAEQTATAPTNAG